MCAVFLVLPSHDFLPRACITNASSGRDVVYRIIRLIFSYFQNATRQLITVVGCVRKGRPPEVRNNSLICEEEQLTLNITSASSLTVEAFILIPFPEPDVWFLALQSICYYKG